MGGIPITRIETLSGGVFNRDRLGYADIKTIDKYQSYVMESGDLLLSHINSKSYIGRVVVYVKDGDETIIHGMNLLRLKVIPDLISPFYMYYYSQTHKFKSQIANRRKDAVNQSSISVADLKTLDVPIPPLSVQERIVAELNCLSGVIERKREQLRELDALAQSIFYQMFGDPITNEKGWEVSPFNEVAEVVGGSTPKTNIEEYWNGNNYWVTPAELHGERYICSTERCITDDAVNKTHLTLLPIGTVLLSSRAPIGKVCITRVPMYCNQGFKNIICSDRLHYEYVYQFLLDKTEYLNSLGTGATFKEISKRVVEQITIPVPPMDLQYQFAKRIDRIEQQKKLISQSIKEVEDLFNSRMNYYFN